MFWPMLAMVALIGSTMLVTLGLRLRALSNKEVRMRQFKLSIVTQPEG